MSVLHRVFGLPTGGPLSGYFTAALLPLSDNLAVLLKVDAATSAVMCTKVSKSNQSHCPHY